MKLTKIEAATADQRGSISDILYSDVIHHVAIIESKAGSLRGNHYHKETTQYIYMNRGYLRYWFSDLGGHNVQSILVEEGSLVETPPNEVHALECPVDSTFTVFSRGIRGGQDYESDTYRDYTILTYEMFGKAQS
jgi:dTDP-4-dehydrorhamnose 3,5-epimerase-like enzyme